MELKKRLWNYPTAGAGAVLVILLVVALRQCSGHKATTGMLPPPELPARDAPWKAALWAKVLVSGNALLGRTEHLVTDPAFLEPLDRKLNALYLALGHTPASEAEQADFFKKLEAAYREALQSQDGLQRLETKIRERWEQPKVTENSVASTVLADYGVIPGKIGPTSNSGFTITTSEYLDAARLPKSNVVAGLLEALVRTYPQAREIGLRICPLQDGSGRFCEYQYRRNGADGKSETGILTASPATDKASPFHKEWTHYVQHDDFSRWTSQGYALHQSLRDQVESPLAGALLEMGVRLALVIHAGGAEGLPLWRPDSLEIAIRTGDQKWLSTSLKQVPRLLPQAWQGQVIATWPVGQIESSQLATKAAEWEQTTHAGQRGARQVESTGGIRYELRSNGQQNELVMTKSGTAPETLLVTGINCHSLSLSPDGQWLAFRDEALGVLVYQLSPQPRLTAP
ncbi:MAG: hypothetical protein ACAI34_03955 [Verrucomicrobium sp.]